jgi:hypothetical protein
MCWSSLLARLLSGYRYNFIAYFFHSKFTVSGETTFRVQAR